MHFWCDHWCVEVCGEWCLCTFGVTTGVLRCVVCGLCTCGVTTGVLWCVVWFMHLQCGAVYSEMCGVVWYSVVWCLS